MRRSSYRKEKNELKGSRDKDKKTHVESKCDEVMEFHRTGIQVLTCTKKKQLSWKDNHEIQTIFIEVS